MNNHLSTKNRRSLRNLTRITETERENQEISSDQCLNEEETRSNVSLEDYSNQHSKAIEKSLNQIIGSYFNQELLLKKENNTKNYSDCQRIFFEKMLQKSNLRKKDRTSFMRLLNRFQMVKQTLKQLTASIDEEIFEEVTYLTYEIIQQYQLFKESFRKDSIVCLLKLPRFTDFLNIQQGFYGKYSAEDSQSHYYEEIDEKTLYDKANETAIGLYKKLAIKNPLRILKCESAKGCCEQSTKFEGFLKVLSRAIFGSCENFLEHPSEEQLSKKRKITGLDLSDFDLSSFNEGDDEDNSNFNHKSRKLRKTI